MARATTSRPRPRRRLSLAAYALVAAICLLAGCGQPTRVLEDSEPPNVILVLADDLDARLLEEHLANYPNLRELADEGTTFENAFVTDPLCCPSRATILRGQYAHNHKVVGNWWPKGGWRRFRESGDEGSTLATWLHDAGYHTALVGKYMNEYQGTRIPAGWDEWHAISGGHKSTRLSENGRVVDYDPARYHLDDVLADKAAGYVRRAADENSPFFVWLGTTAPHAPATPAPRHEGAFPDARLPRPPSFNEKDISDKPDWVRDNAPLDAQRIAPMQDLYRKRLQSMLSVDDMIGRLVGALKKEGELDNTYFFFTSDNGWHAGEHRLTTGKWTAYEEDIHVPLIVRGPGVPEGRTLDHLVVNNDLAPTFAELGGAQIPEFVDGRSLVPLLGDNPPPTHDWRSAFLVEAATELGGTVIPLLSGDQLPEDWQHAPREDWGRPEVDAIRTRDFLYAEYGTGEREFYDLKKDPYELNNVYDDADLEVLGTLRERLAALRDCAGAACRAAEDGR